MKENIKNEKCCSNFKKLQKRRQAWRHYLKDSPPLYNLSTIAVPTYLYWSDADWLADAIDVEVCTINIL